MPSIELLGQVYEVDEDGFIQEPDRWNEDLAKAIAKVAENIEEMNDDQWKIVRHIRNYYLEYGQAPMIRKLCQDTGIKLKKVYELFPSGPARGACKIAGLPKPTGCV